MHMPLLSKRILFPLGMMLLVNLGIEADQKRLADVNPSRYVSQDVWNEVKEYLIANNHPIKKTLDRIFSNSRVLYDLESMRGAGFDALPPQHQTQMIVAKHPDLQGYVIKAYLDEQDYYKGMPEYEYWIKRVKGAELIRESINAHKYDHFFKVPKKWLYLLPDDPSPPSTYLRKMFILVVEDMELFDNNTNENLWGSEWVTEDLLDALYTITTELGLLDSARPENCSFSIDGKGAFVDTELYHKSRVKYFRLTPYLSPSMQKYWKKITKNKKKK